MFNKNCVAMISSDKVKHIRFFQENGDSLRKAHVRTGNIIFDIENKMNLQLQRDSVASNRNLVLYIKSMPHGIEKIKAEMICLSDHHSLNSCMDDWNHVKEYPKSAKMIASAILFIEVYQAIEYKSNRGHIMWPRLVMRIN